MCTISVNVNESELRSFDPMLTDTEAITRWVQLLVDSTVRRKQREAHEQITDDLSAEERAYWAQSVERDLADMAEGKTAEYVSGDEFWSRFEQAAMKHYEDVPAEV